MLIKEIIMKLTKILSSSLLLVVLTGCNPRNYQTINSEDYQTEKDSLIALINSPKTYDSISQEMEVRKNLSYDLTANNQGIVNDNSTSKLTQEVGLDSNNFSILNYKVENDVIGDATLTINYDEELMTYTVLGQANLKDNNTSYKVFMDYESASSILGNMLPQSPGQTDAFIKNIIGSDNIASMVENSFKNNQVSEFEKDDKGGYRFTVSESENSDGLKTDATSKIAFDENGNIVSQETTINYDGNVEYQITSSTSIDAKLTGSVDTNITYDFNSTIFAMLEYDETYATDTISVMQFLSVFVNLISSISY